MNRFYTQIRLPEQWRNALAMVFAVSFSLLIVSGAAYGLRIAVAAGMFSGQVGYAVR